MNSNSKFNFEKLGTAKDDLVSEKVVRFIWIIYKRCFWGSEGAFILSGPEYGLTELYYFKKVKIFELEPVTNSSAY